MSRLVSMTDCPITIALCTMEALAGTPAPGEIAEKAVAFGPGIEGPTSAWPTSSCSESCGRSPSSSPLSFVSLATAPPLLPLMSFGWFSASSSAAAAPVSDLSLRAGTELKSTTSLHRSPVFIFLATMRRCISFSSPRRTTSEEHWLTSMRPPKRPRTRRFCQGRGAEEDDEEGEGGASANLSLVQKVRVSWWPWTETCTSATSLQFGSGIVSITFCRF
mmetsp:Transcript_43967/g.94164  ORF Transcript_43967/g.94164 Transcript_43967/m.94164 type:complete len:219 (+) Transcript_43967:341-997(+)